MVNTSRGLLKSHFDLSAAEEHDDYEEEEKKEEEASQTVSRSAVSRSVVTHSAVPAVEEEPPYSRPLHLEEISVNLGMLGKTADGLGYTYLKVTINGLALTSIDRIGAFIYLQQVDLSDNKLNLNALQEVTKLPYLVVLQADKNALTSAGLNKMKYFQILILNDNAISTVHNIYQPEMSTIEIANNNIQQINFEKKMPKLRCLDLRSNQILDIKDIDFPILDSLYLANNNIKSLVGLEKLVNLRILHVRNNPIRLLDGFDAGLSKLEYINLRSCKVSTLKQIKKLRVLKGLEALILKGTPYMGGAGRESSDVDEEEDSELVIEVLAALQRLKRLNKHEYTTEDREEAKELMLQWVEQGDNDEEEEEIIDEEEQQVENGGDEPAK